MDMEEVEIADEADALAVLRAIYQSPQVALSMRMRAAEAALPFERPKLAMTAVVDAGSLAEKLQRARLRAAGRLPLAIAAGSAAGCLQDEIERAAPVLTDGSGPFTSPRGNRR